MTATVAVLTETAAGERRVALDPAGAGKLVQRGVTVRVQAGAGEAAGFDDAEYRDQGAEIADDAAAAASDAAVLLAVQAPPAERLAELASGGVAAGVLLPHQHPELLEALNANQLNGLAMELIPRVTRAQAMDVLSSQATIAGYKAALIAADLAPRIFPMLTTAAGTLRPATVVVIGAGVAGLQAIATCRRLGAKVEAYDIRAAAREQVESVGGRMIETGVDAETEGGYARELTDAERQQQADVLSDHLAKADAVISTAALPGKPAPKIVTAAMVERMARGAVIVDLAAESGGNCELTEPGETGVHHGVTVAGPLNLPSRGARHASEMFSRNCLQLLELVIDDNGELALATDDEIIEGCLLTHAGSTVHPQFKQQ